MLLTHHVSTISDEVRERRALAYVRSNTRVCGSYDGAR